MNRRALGGVMLAVMTVAVFGSAWAWWRAWSAPLVSVVFRPAFSVQGVTTGTPVRVRGVVVGQVASVGLALTGDGRLRPDVRLSLNPSLLEDHGFAEQLRGDQLREEVRRGLRARLVAVSPASGFLQVELLWDSDSPLPDELEYDEIPAVGGTLQRAVERIVKELERATGHDFALIAEELERALDAYFPRSDPGHAARLSARWVARTQAVLEATDGRELGGRVARLAEASARLRATVERLDERLDEETLALLQVRMIDAAAALASFSAALEGSRERMEAPAKEVAELLRSVSEVARVWSRKVRGLSPEPVPR